jgi:hypothetical protein
MERLSCRTFAANAVRLQLHALAYNLGNFMRSLAMPKEAEPWSLTSPREADQDRREVRQPWRLCHISKWPRSRSPSGFKEILMLIAQLRAPAAPA